MNHGAAADPRTTRSTPSAPIPVRRSHSLRTTSAPSSSRSSRSGRTMKSLPVPCPLAKRMRSMLVIESGGLGYHRQRHIRRHRLSCVQPPDSRIAPEPGFLAAGEPARQPHGLLLCLRLGPLAVEEPEHLRVPERLARGPACPEPGPRRPGAEEPADLLDQAIPPHLPDPDRDPPVEVGTRHTQADLY